MTIVRGVAYFGCRILRHINEDMRALGDAGVTDVLHTFSETDLRYYSDQMSRIVSASHEAGLRVMVAPFGVGGLFGGEEPSFFVAEHPEHRQVDSFGRGHPRVCPADPATLGLLSHWLDAAAATGADQVLWDEPTWAFDTAGGRGCRCSVCLGSGEADDPARPERVLVDFLGEVILASQARGLANAVCILPSELGHSGITDWTAVARLPGLDELSSDPYWKTAYLPAASFVTDVAERLLNAVDGTSVNASCWVQGYGLDRHDEADFAAAVGALTSAGIDRIWTWGFEASAHMTELGTSDQDIVWEYMIRYLTQSTKRGTP